MMNPSSSGVAVLDQMLDFARRLERNNYGWRAAYLHLSKLKAQNRREFHLRIAANEFEPLLRKQVGELFQLETGDMVYFWKGETTAEVDDVVLRLRYLFSDDPLISAVQQVEDDGETRGETAAFCSWYDLEQDYSLFLDRAEAIESSRRAATGTSGPQTSIKAPGKPLDPATLARLEQSLATFDLSALIRWQPICAALPEVPPRPVFTEAYIAIGEMAKQLVPGVDLISDPLLFQRLVETLDRHLLYALGQSNQNGAISINLRLPTLLSPNFLQFDKQFRSQGKAEMVIELQLVDIFAELGGYMFIRDFLRERGYRICIDGLHHLHLPLISRKRLGADLMKLVWSPDLLSDSDGRRVAGLAKAIDAAGTDRLILCRCDSSDAVKWGQSFGVRLFQGYYLDSRLRAQRAPAVKAARAALRGRAG